jgi:plasmid stabilization system protein ParE
VNLYTQQAQYRRWLEAAQGDLGRVEAPLMSACQRAKTAKRPATAALVSEELARTATAPSDRPEVGYPVTDITGDQRRVVRF